jgi:hypothetical protein
MYEKGYIFSQTKNPQLNFEDIENVSFADLHFVTKNHGRILLMQLLMAV